MNSSRPRGFVERTIDSTITSIWAVWWLVFVLALTYSGPITKDQLVHTTLIMSVIWFGWMLFVFFFGIIREVRSAKRRYGRLR